MSITPEQGAITQLFASNAPEARALSGKVGFMSFLHGTYG